MRVKTKEALIKPASSPYGVTSTKISPRVLCASNICGVDIFYTRAQSGLKLGLIRATGPKFIFGERIDRVACTVIGDN